MYDIKRLKDCTFTEINSVWNKAFSNYSFNFSMSVDQIGFMIGKRELSPQHSVVIFDQEKPVGFLLTSIKLINGFKMAWNGGTGISPQYQGRGLGNILMEEMGNIYRIEGVELATLEVLKSNKGAIKLYEKYGYIKEDTLTVLKLEESPSRLNALETITKGYKVQLGSASDAKNITFYNHDVAWSSRFENVQNGRTVMIKDAKGIIIGYAIFNEYTRINGELNIMLHQCEISKNVVDKRIVLELFIGSIYQLVDNKLADLQTGDFTSSTEEVIPLLKEIGFKTIAERYIMNVKLSHL
ncbi:MAG TPA: GNAT family N-acetyltransferase [Pseudoneobacillus sp.]|nr:GNAT family N-acetyltransferase [Pseudoneobacillus sp.]